MTQSTFKDHKRFFLKDFHRASLAVSVLHFRRNVFPLEKVVFPAHWTGRVILGRVVTHTAEGAFGDIFFPGFELRTASFASKLERPLFLAEHFHFPSLAVPRKRDLAFSMNDYPRPLYQGRVVGSQNVLFFVL